MEVKKEIKTEPETPNFVSTGDLIVKELKYLEKLEWECKKIQEQTTTQLPLFLDCLNYQTLKDVKENWDRFKNILLKLNDMKTRLADLIEEEMEQKKNDQEIQNFVRLNGLRMVLNILEKIEDEFRACHTSIEKKIDLNLDSLTDGHFHESVLELIADIKSDAYRGFCTCGLFDDGGCC